MVPASGENGACHSSCYKETSTLFPSPHRVGTDQAPFTVPVEKVRFYWEDSQVRGKARNI